MIASQSKIMVNLKPKDNNKDVIKILGTIHKDHLGGIKAHIITPMLMLLRGK